MKPILFNTEMVKAILEGRKTVTRRIIKKAENDWNFLELTNNAAITKVNAAGEEYPFDVDGLWATFECDYDPHYPMVKSPYEVSDVLYVRETFRKFCAIEKRWLNGESFICDEHFGFQYKAGEGIKYDDYFIPFEDEFNTVEYTFDGKWKPSIHMPKETARIFLRVADVRVERLNNANYFDCLAEGIPYRQYEKDIIHDFQVLWDSTIKPSDISKYGWDANPYVWVIEFERCDKQEEHK